MAKKKPATDDVPEDIKTLSFEDALSELEDIVRGLEQGSGSLDQAIGSYARGIALKNHCETKLKEAQLRVDKIILGPNGAISTEPSDPD